MANKPDMRVHRNGLTELYRPSDGETVQAHVIFVHGLFGSPDKTWTKDVSSRAAVKDNGRDSSSHAVFWPRELLPKIVSRATIHTWGYDADIDNFLQTASRNSLYQHAGNLLTDLCDLRDTFEDKTIPFIFIAHSLGGLIVKDALNRSTSEIGTRIKDIAPNTFAICFLGTPHRGSKLAKSGRRAITLKMLASSRQPNVRLMQALQQNSEILDRIGTSFFQTVDKHGFRIASFCEETEIRLLLVINLFIVEPDSAKIGHSKEETGTIPANHRKMAKFDSESDTGFRRVSRTIKRWVDEIEISSRKDEYQDCLQSLKITEAGVRYQQVVENHEGTFGWLFENNKVEFIDWLREPRATGPAGRLFWITGKPGSGKSTIMKYAIRNSKTMEHLQASNVRQWHIVPFFFSDRGSEKQRAFQTMLQEILYQLLSQLGDSYNLIFPLYTRLKQMQKTPIPKWDLATLREGISEAIVKSTSKAGICLFMDALDEHGGDNENLCKFFWDLGSKSEGSVLLKICLASRPWPVFQKNFQGCRGFAIHEHTENDIRRYVASRLYDASDSIELQHMAIKDQIQQKTALGELAEDVTGNAQGVFIWVRLVIDELCQGLTDGTPVAMLREILKNIPHELEDLYARALSKVRWVYAAEAHIMLHIVLSSLSPLPTQTLLDCALWLLVDEIDAQESKAQASRLASRTGGLLETVNSGGSSIVQFIHQTAKEYIRTHGGHLTLKYTDKVFERGSLIFRPSSPLQSLTGDEFRNMEGPEFLLLCGVRKLPFSASLMTHLFAYAQKVDERLPHIAYNRVNLALHALSSLLHDESLWRSSSAYTSLKSFTAGPSRSELAIAANWKNMIKQYDEDYDGDFTKAAHLAALGPSILDDSTDRVGMVRALIIRHQRAGKLLEGNSRTGDNNTLIPSVETTRVSETIEGSDRTRMLNSVGAHFHDIISKSTLLTTLISIKSHPFVSEPDRIKIAASLLESEAEADEYKTDRIIMDLDGHRVSFRSMFSFCLHFGSVDWVDLFLEKSWELNVSSREARESLAHCLASSQGFANSTSRVAFLRDVLGKDQKDLRSIPNDGEESLLGVGWPLIWLGSQCGIIGFPHINRGFCSSGHHRPADSNDSTQV